MSDDLIRRLEALKDEVMTLEYLDALWVTSEDYVKAATALAESQAEVERLREALAFYAPSTANGIWFAGGDDAGQRALAALRLLAATKGG